MAEKEDLSLKLLQLQCIIDSKDRELQILREQASHDPEDTIEQLKHQNEALKKQLTSSPSASTIPVNGCTALPRGMEGAASEAVVGLQKSSSALQQLLDMLAGCGHDSTAAKGATANGFSGKNDELVQLNVSGLHMEVPLSVLVQFPSSRLASMFADDGKDAPLKDSQGRYYMPYEASAFSKVITALQARHVFGPNCSYATIQVPRQGDKHADAAFWSYFKDLIHHMGLQQIVQGQVAPDRHAGDSAAAAVTTDAVAAAAAGQERAAQRVPRRNSGGGDRKSHPGGGSSSRGAGTGKPAAADGGKAAPIAAAPLDPAATAAASAAVATALLDTTAFAEKVSAQSAADAQSAVMQALLPLPSGGNDRLLSPIRPASYSSKGSQQSADKSHKSSGPAAAGDAPTAAATMNGGVSNSIAAAALKGLIQQKK